MNALIPQNDMPLYANLPQHVKTEFNYIQQNLPFILAAKSTYAACQHVAERIGLKAGALYTRVRNFIKTGDWRALVDKAQAGPIFWKRQPTPAQSLAFKMFCKGVFERFQRNNKAGYREIILIWRTHRDSNGKAYEAIPGYESWPVEGPHGHPEGWSYKNLLKFGPDNYDAKAARVGLFAASMFRPPVCTTRVGLSICERMEFDDHEWNLELHFPGQLKAMRPRGFCAAECLSGLLTPKFKPTLWDPEAEMKKALNKTDFMWFVIEWLCRVGYRTDAKGSWLVAELGTSIIDSAFQERILRVTRDKVRVSEPGLFDKPAHRGQWGGKGSGNFKHKPLVESSFNLIDNYFAGLPAQTGLDRLTCPEDSNKRKQYFGQLLKAVDAARARGVDVSNIKLPVLTWKQFLDKARDLFEAMNSSDDHQLKGWEELGFHALEYRLGVGNGELTAWQPYEAMAGMAEAQRAAIQAVIDQPSAMPLKRARNMSRQEVFDREYTAACERGEIARVTPWQFCELIGLENGHRVTVNKLNRFTVKSKKISRTDLHYVAALAGAPGAHGHLRTGDEYILFINPWSPRLALVCKEDGAAKGLVEQWDEPCSTDFESIKKVGGKQRHWEASRLQAMQERHATEAADRQHMIEHNQAILANAAAEPEQLEAEERDNARARMEAALSQT